VYSNTSLLVYGNGDGGGGPLASMIERLRRMKNVDGLPKIEMATTADFYDKIEKSSRVLPSWKGELVRLCIFFGNILKLIYNFFIKKSILNYTEVFILPIHYVKS
jgi:hypothetical protein